MVKRRLLTVDPLLKPYEKDLQLRMENYRERKKAILNEGQTLLDFANGHLYFGVHRTDNGWVYREWAPGAEAMYLTGDFNGWNRTACPMTKGENGVFEVFLPGKDALRHGQKVCAVVVRNGEAMDRIPSYADYVVQDPVTGSWDGVIYAPDAPFQWTDQGFTPKKGLYIYECHVGMAQEAPEVGSYNAFRENILPRVNKLGYTAIQIMAIMEHPYYASFGYQVTNFFAPSSRFGTPDELKALINTAHDMGISVLLDVVHSHAAPNTREGINRFDGTDHQFFHAGSRGDHAAWGTKCFDYGKTEVLHFLLSNLKYWQEQYHFDGFRFDGVTSMLYLDHGLGTSFGDYRKYFSMNTDTEAVTYLQLANDLVRQVNPNAITIAEDTSAMPGLCLPVEDGGIGFDYRLAMGVPDLWIRLVKEQPDEQWDMWQLWNELSGRRPKEKVIGYAESHDQALVGDQTLMFRLCGEQMYWGMEAGRDNLTVERGMALHKMIRLLTLALAGEGYLTFMGNEFGHPEWIDFPREGNHWSYHYCRRQWSLADNPSLRYRFLNDFEIQMVRMSKRLRLPEGKTENLWISNSDKTMAFRRGAGIFVFNFHPSHSQREFFLPVKQPGEYEVILATDNYDFGGQGRIANAEIYTARVEGGKLGFRIYLPSRTAVVLRKRREKKT